MWLRSTLLAPPSNRKVNPLSTLVSSSKSTMNLLQENGKSEHNCDVIPMSNAVGKISRTIFENSALTLTPIEHDKLSIVWR